MSPSPCKKYAKTKELLTNKMHLYFVIKYLLLTKPALIVI